MARNELWVSAYAVCDDGSEKKLFEKKDGKTSYFVPKETMKEYERKISDRLSKDISRTVSANPEKYLRKERKTA